MEMTDVFYYNRVDGVKVFAGQKQFLVIIQHSQASEKYVINKLCQIM
jgi:hypothetical protein